MRKLETASNASGLVRSDSCNHDEVTVFYDTAVGGDQLCEDCNSMCGFGDILER
jgi:transcription initiation factor IIE alpha subunit